MQAFIPNINANSFCAKHLTSEGLACIIVWMDQRCDLRRVSADRLKGSGPSWAHPVVTGGRLYLRYADNLYCFDVKAK
ncbi:MAG: hypothetical protein ACYS6K_27975 [Planctomycetota bacterium]